MTENPLRRFSLNRNWPAWVIVLCVAMLVLLAGLQFAWTAQLSRAQAAAMENALANSMRQFEQEAERELLYLLALFQFDGRVRGQGQAWRRRAEIQSLWSATSAHPQLLRRLLAYSPDRQEASPLLELPLGAEVPVEADWDGGLEALQAELSAAGRPGSVRREARFFNWTLYPQARAVVRWVPDVERFRRSAAREGAVPRAEFLILVLDWDYVMSELLPELVERSFAGPDGERLYELAVVAPRAGKVLYRSDGERDWDWFAAADSRRPLRLFRGLPGRLPGPGSPADAFRRRRAERGGELRFGIPNVDPGGAGRRGSGQFGRPRLVVAGDPAGLDLEIAATHVSGSLEGVVRRQRLRNLATGLGVLAVLAGAMGLVFVSSRRAKRLAGMQMEFVAGITHELRTPLSVIRSVGENLADGVVDADQPVQRYGELIRDQGRRLSEMVEQTLQFAALESGKRQFQLVPLDPSDAVGAAVERALPMIEREGFELERGADSGLPQVLADEQAVQQILANLLGNAVKYGRPGRWVRIEAEAGDGQVRIRVRDGGQGIPRREAGRVFDAFFRGAEASEANIQGSGLGLKLSRDLARGMGGDLTVRSDPGSGSEFTLHLPARPGPEA